MRPERCTWCGLSYRETCEFCDMYLVSPTCPRCIRDNQHLLPFISLGQNYAFYRPRF